MGGGRRRREEFARRRTRRLRTARGAAIVVVVVAVAWGGLVAVRSARDERNAGPAHVLRRRGSEVLSPAPTSSPLAPVPSPVTYRIDYRVAFASGTTNVERLLVRRPFDSRTETYIGRAAGGEPDQVRESRFGVLATRSASDDPHVVAVAPGVAEGDARLAPHLDDTVATEVAERRERRRVAGRECDVYRTGGSVLDGPLRRPSGRDRTDICVDASGLLIEAWVVTDGRPLLHRLATVVAVDDASGVGDPTFRLPTTPSDPAGGGGSVGPVAPGSAPEGPALVVDQPPDGFTFIGRFAVVPGQVALADPTRQGEAVAGLTDVWTRGAEVVAVEQSGQLNQSDPFAYDVGSARVEVGPLAAEAELRLFPGGPEIRVLLGSGRFVRVYGTVAADVLVAVARSLRAVPGTGLQPL